MKSLPYDLDKVPDGELSVSMIDANFDTIQKELQDLDAHFVGLFRQVDSLVRQVAELERNLRAIDRHFHVTKVVA